MTGEVRVRDKRDILTTRNTLYCHILLQAISLLSRSDTERRDN